MNRIITAIALSLTVYGNTQTVVYSEDFESGLPLTYTIVDNDMLTPDASVSDFANAWIELIDPDDPTDTIVGSTSFFDPIGRADRWLITPPISLGAFGNILSWEAKSHDASYLDGYDVYISITDTDLTSFIDTIAMIGFENSTWTSREVNLSDAGYNNQTIHIAFVNRTDDGFKLYLDDIQMIIEDPVGTDELNSDRITLYPNPSSGIMNIECEETPEVNIISTTGESVFKGVGKTFDLNWVESGLYIVRLKTSKGPQTLRWIKD